MSPRWWNEFPLPLCEKSSSTRCYRIDLPHASASRSLSSRFFCVPLHLLATPFENVNSPRCTVTQRPTDRTILLHLALYLHLGFSLREGKEEEKVFSSSHVSLRREPRFCSPPSPATWITTILPSSFHLLTDLTIRLCTHARLRARQLTHAANHACSSLPLDPLLQRASRDGENETTFRLSSLVPYSAHTCGIRSVPCAALVTDSSIFLVGVSIISSERMVTTDRGNTGVDFRGVCLKLVFA